MILGECGHNNCDIIMALLQTEKSLSFKDLDFEKRHRCESLMFNANDVSLDTSTEVLDFDTDECESFDKQSEASNAKEELLPKPAKNVKNYDGFLNEFDQRLKTKNFSPKNSTTKNFSQVPLIRSEMSEHRLSDEETQQAENDERPLTTRSIIQQNGKLNFGIEHDKSRLFTTSDYSSYSSYDSSVKSEGSIEKCNSTRSLKEAQSEMKETHQSNFPLNSEENTLLVKTAIDNEATTPTGSCLKVGNKSTGGVHVQFETPRDYEDCLNQYDTEIVGNEKSSSPNKPNENLSKLWSRLQPESSEYTPLSSLKKLRKKRNRQPSGSSTISIGSSSTSTSESRTTEFERKAPDGGWGWVVVFASFMVHCIADGVTMSFGVLYVEFLEYFDESKSLTSWIGSLFMAIPLLAGPLASTLTDRYGCRAVTMCGAVIACVGFFLSSFANSIPILFITVGLITGIGLAVCYVAAIVIVAFYFEKRRSLATGLAVAGSGIGTFIFAPIIQDLLEYFGWRGCLVIIAGIFLNMAVCGALMRDLEWTKKSSDKFMVSNTTCSSRQDSVNQSADPLEADTVPSSTIPSLGELKRLVQSGEITCLLSPDDPPLYVARSESLVLLPTFLNQSHLLPNDLLPYLATKANAYELVSHMYPHLLTYNHSQPDVQSRNLQHQNLPNSQFDKASIPEDAIEDQRECEDHKACNGNDNHCISENILPKENLECASSGLVREGVVDDVFRDSTGKPSVLHRRSLNRGSLCLGAPAPSLPAAPLRNMRMTRQSMTFRGAMLNIHRYRLRASSCPNIFRNSIITIAETEDQNIWSYCSDLKRMIISCLDLKYCSDGAFLIFALSNFILYVFYDTVYMYLTDYAQGVGILPEESADLISAIGILNCLGMIFMGYIGDKPWSSPMLIYSFSMMACGLSVIVMPFVTNYWTLAAASAVFGLFISANYALTAVILVELISLEAFSKSYGFLLLIQGLANLIGPPLVGFIADATGNYTIPFVVSGISIVICGVLLFVIPVIQKYRLKKLSTKDLPTGFSPKKTSVKAAKRDSIVIV